MRNVLFSALGIVLLASWVAFYGWTVVDSSTTSGSNWQLLKPAIASNSTHRVEIHLTPPADAQAEEDQQTTSTSTCLASASRSNTLPANQTLTSNGTVLFVQELRQFKSFQYRPRLVSLQFDEAGEKLQGSVCLNNSWWHDNRQEPTAETPIIPQLAADLGSKLFAGYVYCVWTDGNREEMQQVFLAVSTDHGSSWSQPVILSKGYRGELSMAAMPSVAVNDQGTVGVSWYTRHDTSQNKPLKTGQPTAGNWDLHFRASLDGGNTWLANSLVHEDSNLCNVDINHPKRLQTTPEGRFQMTWVRKHSGTSQLQTASVKENGAK